jgi:hypothetical protein
LQVHDYLNDIELNFSILFFFGSSAKDLSPFSFSTSRRSPSRRAKSRWEPVVEEKVANKVELISKESAKTNTYNSSETTKRAVRSQYGFI